MLSKCLLCFNNSAPVVPSSPLPVKTTALLLFSNIHADTSRFRRREVSGRQSMGLVGNLIRVSVCVRLSVSLFEPPLWENIDAVALDALMNPNKACKNGYREHVAMPELPAQEVSSLPSLPCRKQLPSACG